MREVLTMICWDVQHGNAMFLKSPSGRVVLLDLGKGSYSTKNERFSPVQHVIKRNKLKKIDLLILTHPHRDHIEDINSLDNVKIERIVLPNHLLKKEIFTKKIRSIDRPIFERYWQFSNASEIPDKVHFGDVTFSFFCFKKAGRSRLNNHSVVSIVSYMGFRFVLMGDNESQSQRDLLQNSRFKRLAKKCDILLAAHHGRQDGFYQEMINLLAPGLVIVSDGRPKETSVRKKYAIASRGLEVKSKNGIRRIRKVLSTNSDGVIRIEAGTYLNKPRLKVTTKSSKK